MKKSKEHLRFSKFLRDRRLRLGKKQSDGANFIGVHAQQYSRWESSGILPREYKYQRKLAEFLDMTHDELWEKYNSDGNVTKQDIIPLMPFIRMLEQLNFPAIYLEDLLFLEKIQNELSQPLSLSVVKEIMTLKYSKGAEESVVKQ